MNLRYAHCCAVKLAWLLFLLSLAYYCSSFDVSAQFAVQEPLCRVFHYKLGGDWLIVSRHNLKDDPDEWHPSMTNVVSTYRPVVVKHGEIYEITFRSNLPEPNLP